MAINKLTDRYIQNLKPSEKKTKHSDGAGMSLVVLPSGTKVWQLKYRSPSDDKEKVESFGQWPIVTLAMARVMREESKRLLVQGIDPMLKREADKATRREEKRKEGETLEAIAREWFEKFSKNWKATHSNKIIKRLENDLFPRLGGMLIVDIKPADLLKALRAVEARGTLDTAHRLHQNAGQVWRYAVSTGRVDRDITSDLRGALPPAKGDHFAAITDPAEFGQLLKSIDSYHGSKTVKFALQLAPLFFVRPTELRLATWGEFDLENRLWTIPEVRMKAGRKHVVPISRQALEILKTLKSETRGELLFPSRASGRAISDGAARTALQRLGWDVTIHGFRATASTLLENALGFDTRLIEIQLAHVDRDAVRASYKRETHLLKLDERKVMMQRWADHLDALKNT